MSEMKNAESDKLKIGQDYSVMVLFYIDTISYCEYFINAIIAFHFVGFSNSKLQQELTTELIMRLPFKNKFTVFKNIMNNNYKELYTKYEGHIQELERLYKMRKRLAHSFFAQHEEKFLITESERIPYMYSGSSMMQPQFIDRLEYFKDVISGKNVRETMGKIFNEIQEK